MPFSNGLLILNLVVYTGFTAFLLFRKTQEGCYSPTTHLESQNSQHRFTKTQSFPSNSKYGANLHGCDIFPEKVEVPEYSCEGHRFPKKKLLLYENPSVKFDGNVTKQIEYLYSEMSANIPYLVKTPRSLSTFLNILNTVDLNLRCQLFHVPYTTYQNLEIKDWNNYIKKYRNSVNIREFFPEVFYHQHGLRFADERIQKYIKDRNVVDMGAFIGDSALVFMNYTDKIIYSYEYSSQNVVEMEKTFQNNQVPDGRVLIVNAGISNESAIVNISEDKGVCSGNTLRINGGNKQIKMTTVDDEAKKHNMKVGLIKGDIEGFELKALQGAKETLKRDRPIISLSLYHNFDEFFGIPKIVRELDNYQFEFQVGSFYNQMALYELILFGYPREILEN